MTDRANLENLLARVLEGTGPDRELDADIARALGWKPLYRDDYSKWWPPLAVADARERKRSILHHPTQPLPMFTASLDAVLRDLLPEGWGWARTPQGDKVLVAVFIDIPLPDGSWKSEWIGEIHADDKRALIAACLKAMMEALNE